MNKENRQSDANPVLYPFLYLIYIIRNNLAFTGVIFGVSLVVYCLSDFAGLDAESIKYVVMAGCGIVGVSVLAMLKSSLF